MVLVDTSVWINHFRARERKLSELLEHEEVLVHSFVIGELACGNLANWKRIVALLHALPFAPRADDDEILFFIERHRVMGCGIGLIDAHLLASCELAGSVLWSADKKLQAVANNLKMATQP
ncbi:MAG: VapC toxin family PIN domain ribonuclease [Verrucomicrobia bacterium]|nr:MAG: VapC toxin family PIN domain ribonuclease [Verrucomicrobiota bacterium]